MGGNRKAYSTCKFKDDDGVQCRTRDNTTGFRAVHQLCNKHYQQKLKPSTTPDPRTTVFVEALKVFLPEETHSKIPPCNRTMNYVGLSDRRKKELANIMQLILVHAATQLCQDESYVDMILQSLPRLCNKMSLPIDNVAAQKKRKRETDNLLRERKKLEHIIGLSSPTSSASSSSSSASTSSSSRTLTSSASSPTSSASTSS